LVPAYIWRVSLGCRASYTLGIEPVIEALRSLAAEHSTGPLFGQDGVGSRRWRAVAEKSGLPTTPETVYSAVRRNGTTIPSLVREIVGPRAAVVDGRVAVASRQDVVWVLEEALRDGFSFAHGWHARSRAFGRGKPYSFSAHNIQRWAGRYAAGDIAGLIADAEALAGRIR
jgi:hypothetical protein